MPTTTSSKRKHQQAELLGEELGDCVRRGNLDRVRDLVLIERINVNDYSGAAPLRLAVHYEHAHVARFLLENGADPDAADFYELSALGCAIGDDNVGLAELLLEYGASVEKPFFYRKYSPLGHAIHERSVGMVSLLLRFGAKTDETLCGGEVYSALYIACCFDETAEIVQLLLDHDDGVDVNSFVRRKGERAAMSPLCAACEQNNLENAQLLIQHGARVIFPGVFPDSPSPLVHAIKKSSLELIRFLMDNSPFSASSAPVPETGGQHHPLTKPLEFALEENKVEAGQLLVDHGANVNAEPFLCRCTGLASHESARFLLRNGANVNQVDQNDSGKTPLWIAAEKGNNEMVGRFLRAGADVNIRNNGGETPLGVAHRQDRKGAVYLLLRTSPHVWPRLKEIW